ncbi:hypothetical protein CPB86DRAFT_820778 [Serendipita vermifera]|nr:hypothetical protein CPB86DRAFT_820778 [Serendipita vermifera]
MSSNGDIVALPEPGFVNLDEAQLTRLQWQFRSDISDFIRQRRLEEALQERKTLYNQIVDVLYGRQLAHRADLLVRLPHEIMLFLLQLTLVSRVWRDFLLSEPSLWNKILLNDSYDEAAIVSLQAHLSHSLPLTIKVWLPIKSWDSVRLILLENRYRIDTIDPSTSWGYEFHESEMYNEDLRKFLDALGVLPNLRRLSFLIISHTESYEVEKLLDRYKALRYLTSVPLTSRDLQIAKERLEVDTLETYEEARSILPILATIASLKKVTFHSECLPSEPDGKEVTFNHKLHWTDPNFVAYSHPFPSSILHCLSSLTRIRVEISTKTFNSVATVLRDLNKLDYVQVLVWVNKSDNISLESALSPNTNVRSLQIWIYDEDLSTFNSSVVIQSDQNAARLIETIIKTSLQLMPNIDELDISMHTTSWSSSPFELDGLFSGTDLSLILPYGSMKCPNTISIPLPTLRLLLTCDGVIARSLSSLSLKSLSISESYCGEDIKDDLFPWELDLNQWPAYEVNPWTKIRILLKFGQNVT